MTTLLLVGEPGADLQKLRTTIQGVEPDWSLLTAPNEAAVAQLLENRGADLILAYLGAEVAQYTQVFTLIMHQQPAAIRFALFAAGTLPPTVPLAHQSLSMRDNASYLHSILVNALKVQKKICGRRALQHAISTLAEVPSPPVLYFDIRDHLECDAGSVDGLTEIAAKDAGLVANILKVANSGFYALPRSVGDLKDAINLIGTDALLGLALGAHLFSGLPPPGLRLELLWQHTMAVSELARKITSFEGGDRQQQSLSGTAGLLHDIGLLVLFENQAAQYQPIWQQSAGDEAALVKLEQELLGFSHNELGSLILMLWGLPPEVVAAVANSHTPGVTAEDSNATAELPLVSRAVMAAEWMLNQRQPTDMDFPPGSLEATSESTLHSWSQLGRELNHQKA